STRAALTERETASRYPIPGIFVGCCAQTGRQSAKSMAQSVRTVIFLVMFFSALSTRHSTLDTRLLSLDHPVRPRQNIRRNRHTDLLCRFEIDDELELHRLFHWQVGRLAPFKNLVHVGGSAPVNVSEIDPISHESAVLDKLPRTIHCGQAKFAG